jgi:lipopolysaccharide heptosyltransferase I
VTKAKNKGRKKIKDESLGPGSSLGLGLGLGSGLGLGLGLGFSLEGKENSYLIEGLPKKADNILVTKLSSLGDVVMSLPFLSTIKKKFPKANVDWVSEEPAASLLKGHPLIGEVFVFPKEELTGDLRRFRFIKFYKSLRAYKRSLGAKEYDLAFDLQGLFKSGLQMFWANSPRKIGFSKSRECSSLFLDHKLPPYDPNMNALLRYLLLAKAVGASPPSDLLLKPYFRPLKEDIAKALELTTGYPGPKAVLVTGARWKSKTWPISHFAKLIDLLGKEGLVSVLIGGRGDAPTAYEITSRLKGKPPLINLVGRTSPGVMAAVLLKSSVVVSADTGPAHLAAAVGSKTLVLFGPTLPERTGPLTPGSRVLRSPLKDCLGCLSRECPRKLTPSCMEDLKPETVFEEAMRLKESLV